MQSVSCLNSPRGVDSKGLLAVMTATVLLAVSVSAVGAFEASSGAQASAATGSNGNVAIVVSKGLGGQVTAVGWDQPRSEVTVRRTHGDSGGVVLTKAVSNGRTIFTVTTIDPTFLERLGLKPRQIDLTAHVPRHSRFSVSMGDGSISITSVQGPLQVDASNGAIDVRDAGSIVRARCSNGVISVTIAHLNAVPEVDLSITNGPIELRVPKGFSAQVNARTTFGPVNNQLASNAGPGHANLRAWAGPIDVTTSP